MAGQDNLEPIRDTERARELGAKGGRAKKGSKHLSTHIQNMLNDDKFEAILLDSKKGTIEYKGAPIKAIIQVAIHKAIHDKDKGERWAEWLAKHGYGTKLNLEVEDPIKLIIEKYGKGEISDVPKAEKIEE